MTFIDTCNVGYTQPDKYIYILSLMNVKNVPAYDIQ